MKKKFISKRVIFLGGLIVFLMAFLLIIRKISVRDTSNVFTEVEKGSFEISVSAAGELFSERSVDLKGPMLPSGNRRRGRGRGRSIHSMSLKIVDIVPEGTVVKKGDYVAQLDRTDYENLLKDETERLKTIRNNLNMKLIDTAVSLTDLRNGIKNQSFAVEMATFTVEKSKYEPPAVMRRAKLDLDRQKRILAQKKRIYNLRKAQKTREISNARLDLSRQIRLVGDLNTYLEGFTISSPAEGMVVYKRNWNGTKRKVGSTINPFDMVVATLPDLLSMASKAFISEIDIGKLRTGQRVNVKVDAFPDKNYSGEVKGIAKVGEKLPGSDSKMFEIVCRLNEKDPALRPSMTTGNEILIKSFDDAVYVPLECVYTNSEGLSYVFTRKERTRQVILPGESNDKYIMVREGLEPGTEIYLTPPENSEEYPISGANLLSGTYRYPE